MIKLSEISQKIDNKTIKHPKCKGFEENTINGIEFDCGYYTSISCEDCKYGSGRKDPSANCNQIK